MLLKAATVLCTKLRTIVNAIKDASDWNANINDVQYGIGVCIILIVLTIDSGRYRLVMSTENI
jgi:hypothetical protein